MRFRQLGGHCSSQVSSVFINTSLSLLQCRCSPLIAIQILATWLLVGLGHRKRTAASAYSSVFRYCRRGQCILHFTVQRAERHCPGLDEGLQCRTYQKRSCCPVYDPTLTLLREGSMLECSHPKPEAISTPGKQSPGP